MKTVKRYKNPAGGKLSRVFCSAGTSTPVLPASRASSRCASSTEAPATTLGGRLGSRASSSTRSCSSSETTAVEVQGIPAMRVRPATRWVWSTISQEATHEAANGQERDDPVTEEEKDKKEVKVSLMRLF